MGTILTKRDKPKTIKESNSGIEESIYSEKFDEDNIESASIAESIVKVSGSGSSIQKPTKKREVIESGSIIDEIPSARESDYSSVVNDSIADDVSIAKDLSDKESEIPEDSFI
jgi:predicted transcriptional regulator